MEVCHECENALVGGLPECPPLVSDRRGSGVVVNKHSPELVAKWIERIIGSEGALSLDPNDNGNWTGGRQGVGELKGTKWGIAAHVYGHLDIRNLTVEDAAEIYIRDYLTPLRAERYEAGVAFQLLDFAINSGVGTALRRIQRAVGVADDGKIGPITLAAIERHSESDLIMLVCAERLDYMTRLSTWDAHGRGWVRRMAGNLRYGAEDSE